MRQRRTAAAVASGARLGDEPVPALPRIHRAPQPRTAPSASRRMPPGVLAAVAAGGAAGTAGRYGLAHFAGHAPGAFPWATFAVNVAGSFALGFALVVLLERFPPTRYLRPFVGTGLIGSFTTYSTFAVETDLLLRDGRPVVAAAYVVASVVLGLAAAWAGTRCGRALPRPRRGGAS